MAWFRIGRFVMAVAVAVTTAGALAPAAAGGQEEPGCACARPNPRACEQAWQGHQAIFVGRVLEITPGRPPELEAPNRVSEDEGPPPVKKVKIEVREVLRGLESMAAALNAQVTGAARQIDVYTYHGGGADCGYDFDVGESYLIYAYESSFATDRTHSDRKQSLVTSRCTRTQSLPEADQDLAYLRSLKSGASDAGARPTGAFYGSLWVLREDYSRIDHDRSAGFPLAGIPLVLTQDERTWRTVTAEEGAFVFTGLPRGKFSVQAELDGTPYFMEEGPELSLPDARACDEIGVGLRDDGRLRSRVLTAGGKPARGLKVHLMGMRDDGVLTRTGMSEATDADGSVAFKALPPGRYVLGLGMHDEMVGPVTRRTPLLAASYVEATRRRGHRAPGLPDVPGATSSVPTAATDELVRRMPGELVVTLAAGQHVVTEDLTLPETITLVPITGRVVTPAGRPVPNVDVTLMLGRDEDDESHPLADEDVRTDTDGRFQLLGALGWRYWVDVNAPRDVAADIKRVTWHETFLAARDLPPVTVTVTVHPR